ncbi:MAG TPA: putative Ig domain-containing protein, partial [Ideonella sp.]|uniref:putative Ig domain-containing protein n=1 Tax=Ideonella sp. TaxID=1929293 RepID=UPI002E3555C6
FTLTVGNTNDVPASSGITAQSATEDSAFSFTVPSNTFSDVDMGDTLSYSATLADGSALPGWLSFDAATRSFSGTPANGDVGAISVCVTATDGSSASVSSDFTLTVVNTNDVPASSGITAQSATEDSAFSFTVPSNTFSDVDAGDTLTYSATQADGSALPGWLSFDAATRSFSGTPANGDVGAISVRVTATDGSSASVSSDFTLTVGNTNDVPASTGITAQSATEDSAFSFTVPLNTFNDVDAGDTLSYEVTLADGSALPSWLSFDAATRTFTGTPTNGDVGAISVRVTATDGSSATASCDFTLTVGNTNDAPTSSDITAQSAIEDGAFSFTVPSNTFSDVDAGDTLTYSATLADGSALPSWLHFDAATHTFSGTPADGDVGAITVRVTATDGGGATASSDFALTVAAGPEVPLPPVPVAPPPVDATPSPGPTLPAPQDHAPATEPATTFFTVSPSGVALEGMLQPAADAVDAGTHAADAPVPASDGGGLASSTANSASALQVVPQLDAVSTGGGAELSVALPLSSFLLSAPDSGVAVEARLADGQPLPPWLRFDPATGKLTGRVPPSMRGVIQVVLTVRDSHGQAASTRLEIRVDDAVAPGDTPAPDDTPAPGADAAPVQQSRAPAAQRPEGGAERLAARPGLSEQLRHARHQQRSTIADRLATAPRGERAGSAPG